MRIPLLSWLFLIHIFTISVSSQCLNEQKSLLLQLKNTLSFNPENSTILTNWTQTLDCCQWKGVTCDQNGRVTGLDLSSESISSGIDHSSALFSLSSLETLNLTYNSLNSSPIPSSIGDLANLRHLNLSNSGFSGQIPTGLSLLTRLVTLDLSTHNYLGNRSLKIEKPNLSALFGNHGGVVELYLDGVNISANGYEWVQAISSSMPNLRVLSLSNCYLSGPISDGIDNSSTLFSLRYLETLNLAYNRLNSSLIPSNIGDLTNLRYLNLSNSGFSGQIPIGLSLLTRLVTLDLSTLYFPRVPTLQIENPNLITLLGLGFGMGAGFVVGPLVFWKQGSRWCDEQIEKFVSVIGPTLCVIFGWCGGVKVETESTIEEHETGDSDEGEDGEEMEEEALPGRYCVFCSKLDIHRKKALHGLNCGCHGSPPISSPSTSSSSSSS
ncbi:hypothetical protein RHGRI_015545 [Rhododendron griersonianum]|uniref:Leucine-rich repeat-containing N-terminal plant-type domain-containing protein n=1 Tax=Rhododendron griersonianum TaxID=479676 RepID=A0AAV6KDR3_9ERIC|nr:hypothetical protein RHGRI_015545 [Rhododendron griersonianum]